MNTYSYYGHPEIRVFVEEPTCYGTYYSGSPVLSIIWQTDSNKNYSLRQAYAPKIEIPLGCTTSYAKKLSQGLLELSYVTLKDIVQLLRKHKVEKRRFMNIGRGCELYQMEAVPVKYCQFAEAWWKARESGKKLTITK